MSKLQRIRFGEFLTLKKIITDEELLLALSDHWTHREAIGRSIIRLGFATASDINKLAREFHSLETVEAKHSSKHY